MPAAGPLVDSAPFAPIGVSVERHQFAAQRVAGPLPPTDPMVMSRPRERARLVTALAARRLILAAMAPVAPRVVTPTLVSAPPSRGARDAAIRAHAHKSKPAPVSRSQPEPAPNVPPGSPGSGGGAVAGSAGAASGGTSAAMWSAVLFAFLLTAGRDLRRHRAGLLLAGPTGISSPQQRPG